MRPFIIAVRLQIGALLGSVVNRAVAVAAPTNVENVLFVALAFLFVRAALEVVAVTRNPFAQALLRAEQVSTEDAENRVKALRR